MKIVDRNTFLAMSCPTCFAKANRRNAVLGELEVKVGQSKSDFISIQIPDFEADDSSDFGQKYRSLVAGVALPLSVEESSRDGLFEGEEIMFCVLERGDLLLLREMVDEAIEAATRPAEA